MCVHAHRALWLAHNFIHLFIEKNYCRTIYLSLMRLCCIALCIFRRHCALQIIIFYIFIFFHIVKFNCHLIKATKNSKAKKQRQSKANELNCALMALHWFRCCCCCFSFLSFWKFDFIFASHLRETGIMSYGFGNWNAKLKERVSSYKPYWNV